MIKDAAVTELQQILLQEHGQQLTFEETKLIGARLVHLYQNLLSKNENKYQRLPAKSSK